jgi:AraC-like DNA-binding protein
MSLSAGRISHFNRPRLHMPQVVISAFTEPDDFESALGEGGGADLLVTGGGRFRARLIRIMLPRLRLSAGEEWLSRIAFVSMPQGWVRFLLRVNSSGSLVCGGVGVEHGAILALSSGRAVHERLDGSGVWSDIWASAAGLASYGRVLAETVLVFPPGVSRWQPAPEAFRRLTGLHAAAIRLAETQPGAATEAEAIRGLEHELIEELVECLSAGPADAGGVTMSRHADLMSQFEALLRTHPDRIMGTAEICSALGVSERTLRGLCEKHLGIGLTRYQRLRRLQLARRVLRNGDPATTRVSEVARRYGFREVGRFASTYRALFGELPSATLRRNSFGS